MEADLTINGYLVVPGSELEVSVSRSSGPGGQHVNKTSSRVSLRWNVLNSSALTQNQKSIICQRLASRLVGEGELLIHVESERSQITNRRIARERLATLVAKALKPVKRRVATKPTSGSKKRRLNSKSIRGAIKKLRRPQDEVP